MSNNEIELRYPSLKPRSVVLVTEDKWREFRRILTQASKPGNTFRDVANVLMGIGFTGATAWIGLLATVNGSGTEPRLSTVTHLLFCVITTIGLGGGILCYAASRQRSSDQQANVAHCLQVMTEVEGMMEGWEELLDLPDSPNIQIDLRDTKSNGDSKSAADGALDVQTESNSTNRE